MNGNRWNRFGWEFDPWREFRRLQHDVNRVLGDGAATVREYPAVNLWNADGDVILTAEIPGIAPDELDVSVHENLITLKGTRRPDELKEGENYHRQERGSGNFTRSIQLPFEVDADKVEAKLEKGVLELKLPRAETTKPRKIAVSTN